MQSPFAPIVRLDEDNKEYWLASELQVMLGYATTEQEEFGRAVRRAKSSCKKSGNIMVNHFSSIIVEGGGEDIRLSRFAIHLVTMNGDVNKVGVARVLCYMANQVLYAENIQANREMTRKLLY